MSIPPNESHSATIRELQKSKELLNQVLTALESQKATLKPLGISLPLMVLNNMTAIQNDLAKLEANLVEERTELGQLRALATMSAQINTSLDVDTVLRETMDVVIALTRAERGYIILIDPAQPDTLDYRISRDDTLNPLQAQSNVNVQPQISTSIVNHVIQNKAPLLTDNAYQDQRLQSRESIYKFTLRSVLCVPLLYQDRPVGVVYVDNRLQAGIFTEREMNTLVAFANTAAVAIENARLFESIQDALSEITRVKELMDNVFASVGSGIIATDQADIITIFNRAAQRILEQDSAEAVGRTLEEVMPKINSDIAEYLNTVRQKGDGHIIDGELLRQTGDRIAVAMKLTPLKDSQTQTIQGVAVVLDDITEKRERDVQLRIMKTYLPPEMVDNIHTISNLALGGERREVTCMFVEVRPLSSLKNVRPKEIMEILNVYLGVATEAIYNTKGIIDKYMGTEVMAIYNTQLSPQQNHSWLAIEASMMIREAFVELYRREGIDPDPHYYRVGMHTGVATLGNVGSLTRRDFTAIGDSINLSKRLEENALPGQIIISEDTYNHLVALNGNAHLSYKLSELEPMQVKGRVQKTRVYEVFRA